MRALILGRSAWPKVSEVTLYEPHDSDRLHATLSAALGVLVVRRTTPKPGGRQRQTHVDEVKGLGTYLEIEAIGQRNLGEVVLRRQSSESLDLLASTASTASGTSSHGDLNECCQRPAADSVRERQLGQTKQTRRVHDIIRDAKLRWLVRTECSQEGICASHVI